MIKRLILLLVITITFCSCENYSRGERIGMITKFSNKGIMCKSWEGHLNATQTGMNSAEGFDFSIDNDGEEEAKLVGILDSATNEGWKVKLKYHETFLKNLFSNRGETDYFVNEVVILDRNMVNNSNSNTTHGRIVDTIYVVIDKSKE